ncbi:MAG TPA: ubiquinol oxidase subunit II [Steroidobacteraceae bacterium]|nr:ubiquinol oxidase subunit II [Steroidobacteraceae bacterium]
MSLRRKYMFIPHTNATSARLGRLTSYAVHRVALTLLLGLGGCSTGVLAPAGRVARAENVILLDALAIMLAIVIPTLIATLAIAWWFRASNRKARYRPNFAYSGRIELIVWSIPTLVILFLGGVIWIGSHQLDPGNPLPADRKALDVQVVSLDWKWLFIYPGQDVASVNRLVVPAGVPVHFSLTSASVMNVFFVPRLGSMIYTMNRMVTQLHLQTDGPGEFFGESAQFSGDGFPYMTFSVSAVPEAQFTGWVAKAHGSGAVLDAAAYAELSRQSVSAQPFTYRHLAFDVFEAIVSQKLPPGPGPESRSATPVASLRPTS